jgi:Vacuolar protein sorting 55
MAAGMRTIIGLAFILASGILAIILSCALDNNWLPLLVVLTYVFAPIPNAICKRIVQDEDIKGVLEAGYFITSIFIVSGFGLPIVLNRANIITDHATVLSLSGGILIYATIVAYMKCFGTQEVYLY